MTKSEALKLLDTAPTDDSPAAVNKSLTKTQAVEILRKGLALKDEGYVLDDLYEKRVWQAVKNQVRPRY